MAKHTVRVPAALWDEWQPKFSPEEGALLIPGRWRRPEVNR
jgi:hypothetical protein